MCYRFMIKVLSPCTRRVASTSTQCITTSGRYSVSLPSPSAELVDYSLAQEANPGVENPDQLLFFVHDIVLDYLKDTIPKPKQVWDMYMYNVMYMHVLL